jgi:hypothetical protein
MIELTTTLQPATHRRTLAAVSAKWLSVCTFALLVYYALFRLPFRFPPRQQLVSPSYAYGFNNSVAILLTAALLGAVTLLYLFRRGKAIEVPITLSGEGSVAPRSLRITLAIVIVCYAALTFAMYLYDVNSFPWLMWETRHLLHRAWLMDLYGLRPYTEVSAEYGPILTYAPSWMFWLLRPLRPSHEQAYFASYLVLSLAGLWCVYYMLSRVRMPARTRLVAFVVLAVAGFTPYMGVNGVLVRYMFPFASLLSGHRILASMFFRRQNVVSWCGAAILVLLLLGGNILLSPEIGVAFALAWLGYAVLMSRVEARTLVVSVIAFVAAAVLCWLFLPPAYYGTFLRFSEGANNLPLLPAAHLLFYILTLFLIVPPVLAVSLREPRTGDVPGAAICGALGILCVIMAAGALGRCDPPHVLLYGMGASMLLMIRLANTFPRGFSAYAVGYAAVFILFIEIANLIVFYGISPQVVISPHPLNNVVQRLQGGSGTEHPDAATLSVLDRYPRIGLPFASVGDPAVERYVITGGKLDPEYFVFIVGVYNAAALERKLRDVGKMEYILVPNHLPDWGGPDPCVGYLKGIRQWFLYPAKLPCRAAPLNPMMALKALIADNYAPVEQIGSWMVLRRVSGASTPPAATGWGP